MARDSAVTDKIALLATGDEISNGDILNTNTQEIASRLFNSGMHVGMHLITSDKVAEIEQAIHFLLQSHQALIMTGGLGPTSDDLTRFALANAIHQPLVFDEPTWDSIVNRLQRFGYPTPPESNRQQAFFPAGATIIANPHGTAAGCMIKKENQFIFMLPGPPVECLPMFNDVVMPELQRSGFQHVEYHKSWLLFGVSEGQIAEQLDAIAKPYNCMTGYRLFYPYIEFKIHSSNEKDFAALIPLIETTIAPYIIHNGAQTASAILRHKIENANATLVICDLATGGLLETTLKTPKTHAKLNFTYQKNDKAQVIIDGLDAFWKGDTTKNQAELTLTMNFSQQKTINIAIPFRGSRVKQYAVEIICWKILEFLQ